MVKLPCPAPIRKREDLVKIVFLTPGTGSFYCGTCMRDNALARALRDMGHDALMVPMYLPPTLDEPSAATGAPLFFGGVNVYLKQVLPWMRRAPRWLERLLDSPSTLAAAAKRAGMTQARDLGPLTLSMLRGEEGNQSRQLDDLVDWLAGDGRAEVIVLSNVLLVGLAGRIRERTGAKVVCTLHGEDTFLDALPEPDRTDCWQTIHDRANHVDHWVAVSAYHADLMANRMNIDRRRIDVVHNGIDTSGFLEAGFTGPPTIGYLARMCPPKGLHQLVDAWNVLKARPGWQDVRLRVIGAMTEGDRDYADQQHQRAISAADPAHVEFFPNVDRETKIRLLSGCTLLSVPAPYGESFGLYLLEALAAGVPCVQPRSGAFPEVLGATGGGLLVSPDDPEALAEAWETLLREPGQARALGDQGRRTVRKQFSTAAMARRFCDAVGIPGWESKGSG